MTAAWRNSVLGTISAQNNIIARVEYRGSAAGGSADKLLGVTYTRKGLPAIVTSWSWCFRADKEGLVCNDYKDTCWQSPASHYETLQFKRVK